MNEKQKEALQKVVDGENVFLTGEAGVGKTHVLKHIIAWAKRKNKKIGITASTGSAAILIRGTTIHSFLGIGLGTSTPEKLASHVRTKKKNVFNRLLALQLLILDEISMVSDRLLDLISEFLSIIRDDPRPFGGLQVVFSGDCFQLPPCEGELFFKSKAWISLESNISFVNLIESYRHKEDLEFTHILRKLRWGNCDESIIKILKQTVDNIFPSDISPTLLYSKNIDVDTINDYEFKKLIQDKNSVPHTFPLSTSSDAAQLWAKTCKIPASCSLAPGAQVVLTWNYDLDRGLINGARGVVEEIDALGVVVKFINGTKALIDYVTIENEDNKNMWIKFMPLRLAYALTINKSQGMTLDCAIIVLDEKGYSGKFGYGRAYTALSRVRNLKCVQVHNVTKNAFICHPDVAKFYTKNLQCS